MKKKISCKSIEATDFIHLHEIKHESATKMKRKKKQNENIYAQFVVIGVVIFY